MGELLKDIDALLEQLSTRVKAHILPGTAIEKLKTKYDNQLSKIESNADGVVGTTDGTPRDKVSSERKTELYWEISAIRKALLGLRSPDLRIGSVMLAVLVFLLFGSLVVYVQVHPDVAEARSGTAVLINIEKVRVLFGAAKAQLERAVAMDSNPSGTNEVRNEQWSRATQTRDDLEKALLAPPLPLSAGEQLGVLKVDIVNWDTTSAQKTLSALQGRFEDAAQLREQDISARVVEVHGLLARLSANIEKVKAVAKDKASAEDNKTWKSVDEIYESLRGKLVELPVTSSTEKTLGKLDSDIKEQDRDAARDTLRSLGKSVDADIENVRESYFFTTTPGKWFEIAAWSWFGVLVGVVFYLAKQLKLGTFDRQDLPSIIGEIAMAPIVTCVVFFLFSMTGITEFSPTEESMIVVLGFAFLFGYAVRRTVGLLENIKQRVLPTP